MTLTRRTLLKSAVFAAAAASTRVARATEVTQPSPIALRVFDSRSSISKAWLGADTASAIDVAQEQSNRWRSLRGNMPSGRVTGLTSWSDYVQARGALEQKGKRLRVEVRSGTLLYWEMV
jgi:hypothetical protein